MKVTAVLVAAFAAVAAAAPMEAGTADLYLSGDAPKAQDPPASSGNKCSDCAKYCTSDSNGAALSGACLIVKCGIQCLIA